MIFAILSINFQLHIKKKKVDNMIFPLFFQLFIYTHTHTPMWIFMNKVFLLFSIQFVCSGNTSTLHTGHTNSIWYNMGGCCGSQTTHINNTLFMYDVVMYTTPIILFLQYLYLVCIPNLNEIHLKQTLIGFSIYLTYTFIHIGSDYVFYG